jgi:thiamine-phosphate pyrophosphorylase
MKIDLSLYFITDKKLSGKRKESEIINQVIEGGATVFQLRNKDQSEAEMIISGKKILEKTGRKIPFIVNDFVNVAKALRADGVHVGQKDMEAGLVRELIGENMVIGVSVSTVAQAVKAQKDGADYLGVGPVFATSTKKDAEKPIGLKVLENIRNVVTIPIVAIGGIECTNAASVLRIADGIAVISGILKAENIKVKTQEFAEIIKKVKWRNI